MKDTMRSKLTQLVRRLEEIDQNLQDPDVTSNMDQFQEHSLRSVRKLNLSF